MNKPPIATHGLQNIDVDADGVTRTMKLVLDSDGNYHIAMITDWPYEGENSLVESNISLSPTGIELLRCLLTIGLDDILNFPMESND